MGGTVYLKTDRFEVKLEGITFKVKEFESLCSIDFLFPEGKVWLHKPIVGVDVMSHPRDPSIVLLLLCLGIGCVIVRFHINQTLPDAISRFLTDDRICFVGYGVHEKNDLFPFEKLGLTRSKVDVGYLAAKLLNDSKLKKCELAELARKVLRVNKMVGLTEAWSYERHEQIKIGICELFISSVIAMTLIDPTNKNKLVDSPQNSLVVKRMVDFSRMPRLQTTSGSTKDDNGAQAEIRGGSSGNDLDNVIVSLTKKPLKGILKASSSFGSSKQASPHPGSSPSMSQRDGQISKALRRANSKGHNVSFADTAPV